MTSNFKAAITQHIESLASIAGETVTYRVGGTGSGVEAVAVPSRRSYDVSDFDGVIRRFESVDWLIRAADISEPVVGDTITDEDGAVYDVLHLGGTSPHYSWADATRQVYRVHTKMRSAAT